MDRMTSNADGSPAAPSQPWPVLSTIERRLLGVLVEKAKTTPDAYPLSLNALVTGCNQKSNRDPVLDLDEEDVENALGGLQKRQYVQKIVGGRVERWRHVLYETLHVNKLELAILAELLLRGAQTEGELRGRASRMEPIDDVESLRPVLRSLADRGLVVFLGPEGRRGTTISHGFASPQELDRARAGAAAAAAAPAESAPPRSEPDAGLRGQVAALRQEVTQLQAQVAELAEKVRVLGEQRAPS
jgi:uncharacterized protein YceH (UPF0502 family)